VVDNGFLIFQTRGMSHKSQCAPAEEQALLEQLQVRLLQPSELDRCHELLDQHHYLKSLQPVGERLYYAGTDAQGRWFGLLVFSAAAKHLKHRDRWIGWSDTQRERRLSLVTNNSRFVLLTEQRVPNLGSRMLRMVLARLPADWQARYGHPVLVVETFVDPEHFGGTVYTANGWQELGQTDGWGRHQRDYYVKHDKPKRLFARELCSNARRSLQAEHLKPDLAIVEAKVPSRCRHTVKEIRAIIEHFKEVSDFRGRIESYPLWSLLTIILLAVLCEAPRGQKDLAKFARSFSQAQRRALGIRRNLQGQYPAPSQSTFCRLLQKVDGKKVEQVLLAIQEQLRGKPPKADLIALDGKEPKHGGGQGVLTAVALPSQYYLGSEIVEEKTNEIPVAPELLKRLDVKGQFVSLDALNTQDETARAIVLEGGGHYLLTVKGNQPTVEANIKKLVPAPQADFPPSGTNAHSMSHRRKEQRPG
jgi:hypothetical protein